jgi:MFS family permease
MSWIAAGFSITTGSFVLVGGRLGDVYGHRLVWLLALAWSMVWNLGNFSIESRSCEITHRMHTSLRICSLVGLPSFWFHYLISCAVQHSTTRRGVSPVLVPGSCSPPLLPCSDRRTLLVAGVTSPSDCSVCSLMRLRRELTLSLGALAPFSAAGGSVLEVLLAQLVNPQWIWYLQCVLSILASRTRNSAHT